MVADLIKYKNLQVIAVCCVILLLSGCTGNTPEHPEETSAHVQKKEMYEILRDSLLLAYLNEEKNATDNFLDQYSFEANTVDYKDIIPVFRRNCIPCHNPIGNAPFSLNSYSLIKKRAQVVREVLHDKIMPPWMPEKGHTHYMNAPEFNDSLRAMIINWIDEGCKNRTNITSKENYQMPQPDTVLYATDMHIIETDDDSYQCFLIDPHFEEDQYISGFHFISDNPEVVHHAAVFADTASIQPHLGTTWECMDERIPNSTYQIGVWTRGLLPYVLDDGLAYKLPKGSKFIIQAHYSNGFKGRKENPGIGLYFAPKHERVVEFDVSYDLDFVIPKDTIVTKTLSYHVDSTMTLLGVMPHMHFLCKKAECFAITSDNKKIDLLTINEWNYFFQGQYLYNYPKIVPKGATIYLNVVFDNTEDNFVQPNNPVREVRFGHSGYDEMFVLSLIRTSNRKGDEHLKVGHLLK